MNNALSVWQELIVVFGGNATLLVVLAFLFKSLISTLLTKDVEKYKFQLKTEGDISVERLKSTLQMTALEHQVRFSNLHEKRAEVIAELYKRLVNAFISAQRFVSPMDFSGEPNKVEKHREAMNKLYEFFIFFDTHRIYLPESICGLLDKFISDVRSPVITFGVYVDIEYPTEKTMKEKMEVWIKAFETFDHDIPVARKAIEAEFRGILEGTRPAA